MKVYKCLFLVLLLSSCGALVDYDFEKSTNFSEYKTYNYFTDMKTGFSQLDDKRLMRALDAKLKTMGFTKTETPSFRIDIQSGELVNNTNSNVGIGMGGTGGNVGGGVSIGFPIGGSRPQRQVSIEFVDDSKNGVFWQAITTLSNIGSTPEKREASFMKLVEKVFSNYPPSTD